MEKQIAKDFKISPQYRVSKWTALDFANENSKTWKTATDIFSDRINGRFLIPIEQIAKHSDRNIQEFCGFVVMAIDCLLIETLYQFYNGVNETDIEHKKAFWRFFRKSQYFKPHFTSKQAFKFYSHFRCGILHQAQTKMLSQVRIKQNKMVQLAGENLEQGLIIDREKFHKALCDEIEDYKNRLLNPQTNEDFDLRVKFRQKMSFIVKSDT